MGAEQVVQVTSGQRGFSEFTPAAKISGLSKLVAANSACP